MKATRKLIAPFLLISLIGVLPITMHAADLDLFARLAVGKLFLESYSMPRADPFSFSPKLESWIDHEWFSGVAMYLIYRNLGDLGLWALKVTAFIVTLVLCLVAHHHCTASALRSSQIKPNNARSFDSQISLGWGLLTLWPTMYVWMPVVRCQIFTFCYLSLVLFFLAAPEQTKLKTILRWSIALTVVFFANAHGGFVVPLGFFFIGLLDEAIRWRKISILEHLLPTALTAGLSILNPYGLEYFIYLFHAISMPRPTITEWQSLPLVSLFPISILTSLMFIWWSEIKVTRTRRWLWLFLATGAAVAALKSMRFSAVYFLVIFVFGGVNFRIVCQQLFKRWASALPLSGTLAVAVTVLPYAIWHAPKPIWPEMLLDYSRFPVQEFDELRREHAGGKLLVDFNMGSYALWTLYPEYLVSIDGRYEETYPQSTLDLVNCALKLDCEQNVSALAQLDPDFIYLHRSHDKVTNWAARHPEYREIIRGDVGVVLGRDLPANHK